IEGGWVILRDRQMGHSNQPLTAVINTQEKPILRTFVRVIYSTRKYDRLGNAHNPAFDYEWEMVRREAQLDLAFKP
ncbi:MAG: hypothetical protein V4489_07065, partial [Chlamydiota bacterium]